MTNEVENSVSTMIFIGQCRNRAVHQQQGSDAEEESDEPNGSIPFEILVYKTVHALQVTNPVFELISSVFVIVEEIEACTSR